MILCTVILFLSFVHRNICTEDVTAQIEKEGQCPYLLDNHTSCDFKCGSELSCKDDFKCCTNDCGTECMKPLNYTMCQHHRETSLHHVQKSLTTNSFIPECNNDGSFKDKQCDPVKNECWCVDLRGFEISQTRTAADNSLECKNVSYSGNCPLYNCAQDCNHGFELDKDGCRTCTCVDPCASINCTETWETCKLVDVKCSNGWPCSSVPICRPSPFDPCSNESKINDCGLLCPYGYTYDSNDCPLCECYDPCKKIKCEHPTTCEVKRVQCIRAPCLPIAECKN
ncbi:hypothetical protein FQA39_LY13637 [Lamprigera yunnana]|nr:hypothetical protein FQA39_LY13637 [Lamprigera yunnana]